MVKKPKDKKKPNGPPDNGPNSAHAALFAAALGDLAGDAVFLDNDLNVVHGTASARELLGDTFRLGDPIARVLCTSSIDRPVAAALAAGTAVSGLVHREDSHGLRRAIRVRATPLRAGTTRLGWMLLLEDDASARGEATGAVMFHGMWTQDPAMKRMFHIVQRAALRESSVLVRGETGAGKELVAHAIHTLSPRAKGPFRALNCAALPPSLLESELFGHVKGAFTGAVRDQPGIFRSAHGGTLFLDEVAELPVELQAKLLRVLETHTVLPVGGREPVAVDVRIVAATHQSLREAVERKTFRADLMYRLRVVPVFLPPLRARAGDLALLTDRFIDEFNQREKGRQIVRVSPAARTALQRYSWPGNIRELRNVLEYAYVVGDGPVLSVSDLPLELTEELSGQESAPVASAPASAPQSLPPPTMPHASDDSLLRRRVEQALARSDGNRERTAKILGISRVTLWRWLKELGL